MTRLRSIVVCTILFLLFLIYCWILKNKPMRTKSLIFKETNILPDLTFSKLADLENRMVIELDALSMEEYDKIKNKSIKSESVQEYGLIQIIVFISCSISGIILVLCIARRFYIQNDDEFDAERVLSTSVISSQEKLFGSYQTNQN
ncbi:hypothetical protein GCK72_023997 [Caenorhabditis remanei]|uniref:Uncharacterized protein n=1 Tax=Caenorhabditis remanei TaxID=31234 RepID=A0A6A5FYE0_CAERE|nr:hypothetical protein GCK72_023997 [Caenorhabditis remanei]KAF1747532.1 hypothetical protein GCK72_023997 [Caenorhabditis remanei]